MKKLTPFQEGFAQHYVRHRVAVDAYRANYSTSNMTQTCARQNALKIKAVPHVAARIAELQQEARVKHDVSLERLTEELYEAVSIARKSENAAALTSAIMAVAKLHGLDVERREDITKREPDADRLAELIEKAGGKVEAIRKTPKAG